jgi:hypothetical protein
MWVQWEAADQRGCLIGLTASGILPDFVIVRLALRIHASLRLTDARRGSPSDLPPANMHLVQTRLESKPLYKAVASLLREGTKF